MVRIIGIRARMIGIRVRIIGIRLRIIGQSEGEARQVRADESVPAPMWAGGPGADVDRGEHSPGADKSRGEHSPGVVQLG